jgi:hypothetical protein
MERGTVKRATKVKPRKSNVMRVKAKGKRKPVKKRS